MYKNKTALAVITARGGSKGIPKKNIKELGGKPLIAWTIEAARGSKHLDYFLVSTDDEEIAGVSREYGAPVPFMRPAELSTDAAKSIPVVQHAVEWLRAHEGKNFDYVMILQPTSPFRTAEDIDVCIEKIVDTNADSVMSMVKLIDFSAPKLKVLDGDIIKPWLSDEGKESKSRHELADVYKRNCAIYLTRADLIMQGDLFGKVSRAYLMPSERSVDINTSFDWTVVEALSRYFKV
jgi:CMP-N-acetylneuraminic acid synthetase